MEIDSDNSIFTVTGGKGSRSAQSRKTGAGGAQKRGHGNISKAPVQEGEREDYDPEHPEVQIDLDAYRRGEVALGDETIEVEFDVRVFEEIDFKAVARYLATYCHKQWFNSSEMADLILAQDYLGSTIKELGGVETFGFISCVPVRLHEDKECMQQIRKFITSSAPAQQKNQWDNLLSKASVGILFNERLLNVPHALAPELHVTIYEEIEWAVEDGKPFSFTDLIYLTSYGHEDKGAKATPSKTKRARGAQGEEVEERSWFKAEDAIYFKHAKATFTMPKSHSETRVVMQIGMDQVPRILAEIREYVTENFLW